MFPWNWSIAPSEFNFSFSKDVHRPSIFSCLSPPHLVPFWHVRFGAGLIFSAKLAISTNSRSRQKGLWTDCSPLHSYFFIHEVHPPSLPLTKSSTGEYHSQDYHVTLRSRFSQGVQLTDRPRGWSLAYCFWALCKYQERKRGEQELGRNCSHGRWKRKRYTGNYKLTKVIYLRLCLKPKLEPFLENNSLFRPLPCNSHQAYVTSSRDAQVLISTKARSFSLSFLNKTFSRERRDCLQGN